MPKFKIKAVDFQAYLAPAVPLEPPFLPTPTAVAMAVCGNMFKKQAVKDACKKALKTTSVSAASSELASALLWPSVAGYITTAINAGRPAGSSVELNPPRYTIDIITGEHVVSGWLLVNENGATSPYRSPVQDGKAPAIDAFVSVTARVGKAGVLKAKAGVKKASAKKGRK